MEITNDFTVNAPVEHVWSILTDLEVVAPCLPGASLTGRDGENYLGKIKVKVGPVTSEFKGTARFASLDDVAHQAVIAAKGADIRGGGNASATIRAGITAEGDASRVSVVTDMQIAGKLAQFGAGMIQQISEKLIGEFARRLEVVIASNDQAPAPVAAVAPIAPDAAEPVAAEPVSVAGSAVAEPAVAEPAAAEPAAAEPVSVERLPAEPIAASGTAASGTAASATVPTASIAPASVKDDEGGLPAGFVYTPPVPGQAYAYDLTSASAGRVTRRGSVTIEPEPEPERPTPAPAAEIRPEPETPAEPRVVAPVVPTTPAGPTSASGRTIVTFDDNDGEALDLMQYAGGTVIKRFLPAIIVGVVVIAGIVVYVATR